MSEPVWYYARGEVEKGPLSTVQIKALAAAGKIRPDDYVWKEGMENWVPAAELQELFPAEAPRAKDRAAEAEPREGDVALVTVRGTPRRPDAGRAVEWPAVARGAARGALLAGLAAVLVAHGCDRLGERHVGRLQALAAAAETGFRIEWAAQRRQMERQIADAERASRRTPADQEAIQRLTAKLAEFNESMRSQEARLEQTRWQELRSAAEQADAQNRMWGFWRELAMQLGVWVLAGGAVTLAYAGERPERWMAFVLLAVVLYRVCEGRLAP